MNIIQSFFNKRITLQNLNYRGGYLSPFVFWLSIAYSCLLLKRNNPTLRLLFYGNETIVHILKDLFQLPYDKYYICDYNDDYNEWFYCWPKILTYQRQNEPFIHIDSDIFMWTPIPQELLEAQLVAQHKEKDSNFYREVFNEIKKDNIRLPQYMQNCIGNKYISSFNAGIIGGNDLLFLQRYINQIINFVSENKDKFDKASHKFLYNVVLEQWLYYGMTTFEHKEVCTYYKEVITDFDMQDATVPKQIVSGTPLKFMHVMEYKDNIRCNRFIVYNMLNDFPKEYEQILNVCAKVGMACPVFGGSLVEKRNLRLEKLKSLTNLTKLESEELNTYETLKENYKHSFLINREKLVKMQQYQIKMVKLLQNSLLTDYNKFKLKLSQTLKFVECTDTLLNLLVFKSKCPKAIEACVLWVYNPILDRVDEFIWSCKKVQFLKKLLNVTNVNNLLSQAYGTQSENSALNSFIRQCVFDGILNIVKNENSTDIL